MSGAAKITTEPAEPKIIIKWLSSSTTGEIPDKETYHITGAIARIVTAPGPGASSYNLKLYDSSSLDILEGLGSGRSATEVGELILDPPKQVDEAITHSITDQTGLGATGTTTIYLVQK